MPDMLDTKITADEAMRIRLGLAFGDPGLEGKPDPELERAKVKLRLIETNAS